jgi:ornithine cyclodeaminase/alanine dehydrogenase-like protein (mu-crystallin family)
MNTIPIIRIADVEHFLSWTGVCDAIRSGHQLVRADIDDILLRKGKSSLLNRAAWISGLGIGTKTATIFPGNAELTPPIPSVQAVFTLFDDQTGTPVAIIDGDMLTKWKTAADSVLGARLLARPDSKTLLIIGAGVVARSLVEAYSAMFPGLEQILIWSRTRSNAQAFASSMNNHQRSVRSVEDLASHVPRADIVAAATLSTDPVLKGAWVSPGTHVDLIGSYRPDMREADDELLQMSELFADSRETAMAHTGELIIPIEKGVISEQDIRADLYDLCNGAPGRTSEQSITVFKNGGGAHLDLMTANYIFNTYQAR